MGRSAKSGVTRSTSDAIAKSQFAIAREAPAAYAPELVSEPVIA
ncbi:MAG: hypothetical protein U9N46_05770 [Euryarchaeota archaeon]|nr:hypothetical protein [Euryarchaeota archaeon]